MKILVVDDERVLVKGIKFNLEGEGYQVEAGYDGEEAVELALKQGKITPAQRDWAKSYALKSPGDFQDFVAKAPQVVPMGEVVGGGSVAFKSSATPDDATLLVCKQLGISAEDVQKYGMKED